MYNSPEKNKLTDEQQRLVWLYYSNFVREGAKADSKSKARIADINKELAGLFTNFSQNQLADENNLYLELKSEADFDGLPAELKDAAKAEAKDRKLNVMGIIANTRSSMEPFLTFSSRRDLREKAFKIFTSRGDNDNANNNNSTLVKILKLRAEKAKLLGFNTFADWSLSNTMAQKPEKTLTLSASVRASRLRGNPPRTHKGKSLPTPASSREKPSISRYSMRPASGHSDDWRRRSREALPRTRKRARRGRRSARTRSAGKSSGRR